MSQIGYRWRSADTGPISRQDSSRTKCITMDRLPLSLFSYTHYWHSRHDMCRTVLSSHVTPVPVPVPFDTVPVPVILLIVTLHNAYNVDISLGDLFVFIPFILDIKFVGRTSRGRTEGRSHRISHPPSFCGPCLNFSREKDSAIPFPRRP